MSKQEALKQKRTKNMRQTLDSIDLSKTFDIKEAVKELIERSFVKFDSACDICVSLNVDTRKADQVLRGAIYPTHGTGKKVKIAVFGSGKALDAAKAAGADFCGLEDLVDRVKKGDIFFDICVASPDAMIELKKVARVLGPKGLMPNPKLGTVTDELASAVKKIKGGVIEYKADKDGFVHCAIGKMSFGVDKLVDNFNYIMGELMNVRPATIKGAYLKSVVLSSTMGPGLRIDVAEFARGR